MATVTNEDREKDTVMAALAANDPPPKPYEALVALYQCGLQCMHVEWLGKMKSTKAWLQVYSKMILKLAHI